MTRRDAKWGVLGRHDAREACHSAKCESRPKEVGFFIFRRCASLSSPLRGGDARRSSTEAEMTLLELGRIAAKYETEMAHAMLFAVAVAKCYGGGKWIKDIA